jgi:hypothetical protein
LPYQRFAPLEGDEDALTRFALLERDEDDASTSLLVQDQIRHRPSLAW